MQMRACAGKFSCWRRVSGVGMLLIKRGRMRCREGSPPLLRTKDTFRREYHSFIITLSNVSSARPAPYPRYIKATLITNPISYPLIRRCRHMGHRPKILVAYPSPHLTEFLESHPSTKKGLPSPFLPTSSFCRQHLSAPSPSLNTQALSPHPSVPALQYYRPPLPTPLHSSFLVQHISDPHSLFPASVAVACKDEDCHPERCFLRPCDRGRRSLQRDDY